MNTKKTNQCKVVALAIQKGGVAKTTSSIALSAALSKNGYKVLLVDNDPQHNSTRALLKGSRTIPVRSISSIIDDILSSRVFEPTDGIITTSENFDLLPSDDAYAGIELRLMSMSLSREFFLRNYVNMIRDNYDFIIFDCPPNLGMLTINALVAADELLIPAQPQEYSATSIQQVLNTVDMVRQYSNRELSVKGIFLTMFDTRRNEDNYMKKSIEIAFPNITLFKTTIPYSVKVSEAARHRKSILAYDPKGKVAQAYENLLSEVL